MAYTRLNLSDGEVFNASHVSHIEDGIEDCETQLSEVNQSLSDKASTKYYNGSVDTMLSDWSTITGGYPELFGAAGECAQFLTNSSTSSLWFGIRFRSGSNLEYVIFAGNNSAVYYGRVVSGAVSVLRSISGTSISLNSAKNSQE